MNGYSQTVRFLFQEPVAKPPDHRLGQHTFQGAYTLSFVLGVCLFLRSSDTRPIADLWFRTEDPRPQVDLSIKTKINNNKNTKVSLCWYGHTDIWTGHHDHVKSSLCSVYVHRSNY